MAPRKLKGYEKRRLENIKSDGERLAAIKIHSKANDFSAAATKRQRPESKSMKVNPEKQSKTQTPISIRRSLRSRGLAPDASTAGGVKDDFHETLNKTPKANPGEPRPISMSDAYCGDRSANLVDEKILGGLKESLLYAGAGAGAGAVEGISVSENGNFGFPIRVSGSVDLGSLRLEPGNIARVVPGRITAVRFFPSRDLKMIAVGNKSGNVGFWDIDKEDGNGIYLYQPHSGQVSGISVQPFSMSKVYSSCYNGFLRLMDVEKEVFDLVYSTGYKIFSISQPLYDAKSLYFSEGQGVVNIWDERAGKSSNPWGVPLHGDRINSIDFSSENANLMATSSTDGTACIWDLRNIIDADNKPTPLKTVCHKSAVHSAYFSPSGSCLATTSFDDNVGIVTGANFEDTTMVPHNNQTHGWISSFRAIWGWDDSYVFVGNMKVGVDVISTAQRRCVKTLQSPDMSAIPCRFDAHPYKVGMLAGATGGGQVYLWTTTSQ